MHTLGFRAQPGVDAAVSFFVIQEDTVPTGTEGNTPVDTSVVFSVRTVQVDPLVVQRKS